MIVEKVFFFGLVVDSRRSKGDRGLESLCFFFLKRRFLTAKKRTRTSARSRSISISFFSFFYLALWTTMMKSDDDGGSGGDGALRIVDLPDEVIVAVVERSDDRTFCQLQLAHPRFRVYDADGIMRRREVPMWRRRPDAVCRRGIVRGALFLYNEGHRFSAGCLLAAAEGGHIGILRIVQDQCLGRRHAEHEIARCFETIVKRVVAVGDSVDILQVLLDGGAADSAPKPYGLAPPRATPARSNSFTAMDSSAGTISRGSSKSPPPSTAISRSSTISCVPASQGARPRPSTRPPPTATSVSFIHSV